jgi:hypothetical protein
MKFVVNNSFFSSELRGEHIASALGVPCLMQHVDAKPGETVVFVKDADHRVVQKAKDMGCRIAYDILDLACYMERSCSFRELVDVLIVPNRACIKFYSTIFPNAAFCVIPHQWDSRLSGFAAQDTFRPAYIGKGFNAPDHFLDVAKVFESTRQLVSAPQYNMHMSLNSRMKLYMLVKPATKVATAAAVLANVLAYPDPSATELLGEDYPYLVRGNVADALEDARMDFGGSRWKDGIERMREVREKTSIQAIAALYRRMDEGESLMPVAEAA